MKRKVLTGIIVILVLLLGSCDFMPEKASEEVEYTDVVYSIGKDGSTNITLYLDGVGVPRTAAQRALNMDLATMSHDFFEVIFIGGAAVTLPLTDGEVPTGTKVARASWELGQNAGISGVYRTDAGVNYAGTSGVATVPATGVQTGSAYIFVGRKSDKTLLACGNLYEVDHATATTITTATKSVTFGVYPLTSNISYPAAATSTPVKPLSSFLTAAGATADPDLLASIVATGGSTKGDTTVLGGVIYPIYSLDDPVSEKPIPVVAATYTIGGLKPHATGATGAIRIVNTLTSYPVIAKREPRYLDGGVLWYANSSLDTLTKVAFDATFFVSPAATTGTAVNHAGFPTGGVIPIKFTTQTNSAGIFSFNFRIPVYMITVSDSTNGGPKYERWNIQPGWGTPLYNLDNGLNAGGCVLVGTQVKALDWIDIFVTGIGLYPYAP